MRKSFCGHDKTDRVEVTEAFVWSLPRGSAFTADLSSRKTMPREHRYIEFDQSRRTPPTPQQKPVVTKNVNYRGNHI